MVEAHEMQDGRIEVINTYRIHSSFETELVTLAITEAFLNSSTGQETGERIWTCARIIMQL